MKTYSEFPPVKYFLRVLKCCPKSALLYTELWQRKDRNFRLKAQKQDIRKEYLISPTMYRNLLAPLVFLNLIRFSESDEKFQIDLMGTKNE